MNVWMLREYFLNFNTSNSSKLCTFKVPKKNRKSTFLSLKTSTEKNKFLTSTGGTLEIEAFIKSL